jgi:RNA 3'-terminal phosphate cyclase (ATP)
MLTIDASQGEGGGQVVRTALALSVALGCPVRLRGIRSRRPRPGLQPQHLAVVRALAAIGSAEVSGDALDSTEITFVPRALREGTYRFDIGAIRGSAGSASLLFQAMLLPLARAAQPSCLSLVGGTHVPWSPPVHYVTGVFLPALRRIGLEAEVTLHRWGWYPRGSGEISATILPSRNWNGVRLEGPGPSPRITGVSAVSRLPVHIAERQRGQAIERLRQRGLQAEIALVEDREALGPGTLLFLSVIEAGALAGFSALGRRGVRAETVADESVDALFAYLDSGAAVDDHLADQLVPFLALARGPSSFTCPTRSSHLETVARLVELFLPVRVSLGAGRPVEVRVTPS